MTQATKQRTSGRRVKAALSVPRGVRGAPSRTIKGSAPDGTTEVFGTRNKSEKAAKEIVRGPNGRQSLRRGGREEFALGHAAFAKICAVEGLCFTEEMEKDLRELDRRGLSPEERRKFLIAKYGK